jgi:hypothetical protein
MFQDSFGEIGTKEKVMVQFGKILISDGNSIVPELNAYVYEANPKTRMASRRDTFTVLQLPGNFFFLILRTPRLTGA